MKIMYRLYRCIDSVGDTVVQKHSNLSLRGTKQSRTVQGELQGAEPFISISMAGGCRAALAMTKW